MFFAKLPGKGRSAHKNELLRILKRKFNMRSGPCLPAQLGLGLEPSRNSHFVSGI